jgi:hypothetical protein
MVLAFFHSKGLIYMNYVPRETTVNANYIMEALGKFLKIFKQKRLEMVTGDWWFHWNNALVHNHRNSDRLDRGQAAPGHLAPALLSRPHPGCLFPLP